MLARVTREPALILGVVTSALSLAVLFGVDITGEQMAGIGVFLGAVIALLRFLTTPAGEVVTQVKPDGSVVAGDAAVLPTGTPLPVDSGRLSPVAVVPEVAVKRELVKDETGAISIAEAVLIIFAVLVLLILLGYIR